MSRTRLGGFWRCDDVQILTVGRRALRTIIACCRDRRRSRRADPARFCTAGGYARGKRGGFMASRAVGMADTKVKPFAKHSSVKISMAPYKRSLHLYPDRLRYCRGRGNASSRHYGFVTDMTSVSYPPRLSELHTEDKRHEASLERRSGYCRTRDPHTRFSTAYGAGPLRVHRHRPKCHSPRRVRPFLYCALQSARGVS